MAYSRPYLCLGLGLFVILSSQAFALQLPEPEAEPEATLPPGRKMTLDGRMEDFMRAVQILESNNNMMIPHSLSEAEEDKDRNVKRSSDEIDNVAIPPGSGTRRLLGDFRHHIIKMPHHIN
ncbi:hypothetical protein SESBI_46040 [Sesbania bispinosa]|nr:hypothetical protein SESBI_46040 [Sesbania bispinosa]